MNSGLSEDELEVLGATALTPDDPERVGRFRLLGLLGAGGMGRVYLGWADSRLVAVKVIRPELADSPQFRRRFGHELEAVRRLDSEFTASLVDAEAEATRPWMATEFVPGLSLEAALDPEGPLPVEAVWRLAAGTATALAAIHRTGIVHRDLKPSNVLLTPEGPKVIDFGVARAADLSQLTVTGQHVGTPAFMAPEQARTGTVGPASDVFALGGLLMYAATGRPPFGDGGATEVLFRVVHEPPDLTGLREFDQELFDLVTRCLEKDPEQRPDAAALAASIAESHPVTGWPVPLWERIEPRAALAARTSLAEPSAPLGSETAVGAVAGGLPRRAAAPPERRRRGRIVLAAALAVTVIALGGVGIGLLTHHHGRPTSNLAATPAGHAASPSTQGTAAASPSASPSAAPTGSAGGATGTPPAGGSDQHPAGGGAPGVPAGDGMAGGSGTDSFSAGDTLAPTPATSGTAGPTRAALSSGTIVNVGNRMCLDDATTTGGAPADHDFIELYPCSGSKQQQWTFQPNGTITLSSGGGTGASGSGWCIGVGGDHYSQNSHILLWTCSGNGSQQWQTRPDGSLFNPQSGDCMADPESSTASGTQLIIWACLGSASQKWTTPVHA